MTDALFDVTEYPLATARPLSVVVGTDADVIPLLIATHSVVASPTIVDVTHNVGVMWRGAGFSPAVRLDLDAAQAVDAVADCRALPLRDSSVDVLVFDPPHLPAASAGGGWAEGRAAYGLDTEATWREGDNIAPLFDGFLREAQRVLSDDGILLAKLVDLVHNHRYQWQHVDFIGACRAAGMTACDLAVKVDPTSGNLKSGRWERVLHLRRAHCYWIVVRPGARCERRP